jgi:hypothetical protein
MTLTKKLPASSTVCMQERRQVRRLHYVAGGSIALCRRSLTCMRISVLMMHDCLARVRCVRSHDQLRARRQSGHARVFAYVKLTPRKPVCGKFDRLDFLSAVVVKLRSWVIFQAALQRFSSF